MRVAPRSTAAALAVALLLPSGAEALPAEGNAVATVTVERSDGQPRTLPERDRALLVVYEDKDAGRQNRHLKPLLDKAGRAANAGAVEVVAVGDVSAWDFWPAKKYVLADIKEREQRDRNTIFLDWKGLVRERWGLKKGRSGVLLIDRTGQLRFAFEGPLPQAEIDRLAARLVELGAKLD